MNLLINPSTKAAIEKSIDNTPHAVGLLGEKGAGKGHLAIILASNLLGISPEKIIAYPYLYAVDINKEKEGIAKIRELQSSLVRKVPGRGKVRRILIIENLDSLGHEGQNALLKTLEEPPEDTVIITTYSVRSKILSTISSRLQIIGIMPVSFSASADFYGKEHGQDEVKRAYYMSGGLPGLMNAILDEDLASETVLAVKKARELMQFDRYHRLAQVDKLVKDKELAPESLVDGLFRIIHASYRASLDSGKPATVNAAYRRLKAVEAASSDLSAKVQSKLVLSRLFYEL